MNYLVTGVTGFIGGAIALELISRGHSIRALVRPRNEHIRMPHPELGHVNPYSLGIEVIEGDILDRASLVKAVNGVDGIFHAAALYAFWSIRKKDLYDINVGGTELLLNEARAAGVRRVVFTSSSGVLRSPSKGRIADESFHENVQNLPDHYHRSKLLAEWKALEANGHGLEVVVVNPTTPVGPGDIKPTPTGRIVLEFLRRRVPAYIETSINLVDIRDVVAGHIAAFEAGSSGERYILGGENTTLSKVFTTLSRVTGLRRKPIRVPYSVALVTAWVDEAIEGGLLRRSPFIPMGAIRAIRHPMHVTSNKAKNVLGYNASPVNMALYEAARWFTKNDYVRVPGLSRS